MTDMLRSVPIGLASVTTIKVANCTLSRHILDAVFIPSLTTLHIAFCTWNPTAGEESLAKLSEPTSSLCHLALIGLSDSMCLRLLPHITVTKVVELDTDNVHVISHFAASHIPLRRLTIPRLDRPDALERLADRLKAFTTLTEFTLTRLELPLPRPPRFPLPAFALPALRKLTCPASIASQFGTHSRRHLIEAAVVGETVALIPEPTLESPYRKVHTPMMSTDNLSAFRVDNLRSLAFHFHWLKPYNAPFNMPHPALKNLIIQNYSRDHDVKVDSWMLTTTIQELIVICESSSFLPPILDLEFRFAHSEKHPPTQVHC
ncbi:hypothetical protein BDZ89DRAFT_450674 [Hymenopellis radicata]|nr:hypothetical protein BDZ89DRAFT_450674 [Hymenopellis radicata]